MAKLADITLGVHEFFTESRISCCHNFNCRFNAHRQGETNCIMKRIFIDSGGKCASFEARECVGEMDKRDDRKYE